jgi:hypothetical protein
LFACRIEGNKGIGDKEYVSALKNMFVFVMPDLVVVDGLATAHHVAQAVDGVRVTDGVTGPGVGDEANLESRVNMNLCPK